MQNLRRSLVFGRVGLGASLVALSMVGSFGCSAPSSPSTDAPLVSPAVRETTDSCITEAMGRLKLDQMTQTDPALVRDVLEHGMLLYDQPSVRNLFAEGLTKPVSLKPLFDQIRSAIVTKQPAIGQFLCAALRQNLVEPVTSKEAEAVIRRSVHHTYLLDGLTRQIVRDAKFSGEVIAHLLKQRERFHIRSTSVPEEVSDLKRIYRDQMPSFQQAMFAVSKIVSMDLVTQQRLKLRLSGTLGPKDIASQAEGLRLNILEASITDKGNKAIGNHENARSGAVLAVIPPTGVWLAEGTKALKFGLSREWASLYETWNLAFITGNLTHLDILYPKLLAPAVIHAEAEDYIFARTSALWVSTMFHQFATASGRPQVALPHRKELALLWGSTNERFAQTLAKNEANMTFEQAQTVLDTSLDDVVKAMNDAVTSVPLSPTDAANLKRLYEDKDFLLPAAQ